MKPVRWGVLSTATIARLVIAANQGSEHTRFVAVAGRAEERAKRFAADLGLDASFGSYGALLAADLVDAVYVALPVSRRTECALRALQAGKHVDQDAVLEAVGRSAATGLPVAPPPSVAGA